MADYSKWKVTELKAELKARGVPQTGLRLKQDFIEKLSALDSESADKPAVENDSQREPSGEEELKKDRHQDEDGLDTNEPIASQQSVTESLPTEGAPSPQKQQEEDAITSHDRQLGAAEQEDAAKEVTQAETDEQQPEELATAEKTPETKTRDAEIPAQVPEGGATEEQKDVQVPPTETLPDVEEDKPSPPVAESIDDLRKRKRRSQSPPPAAETIKKSKVDNENPRVILKEDVTHKDMGYQESNFQPVEAETRDELEAPKQNEIPPPPPTGANSNISAGRQDPRFKDLLPPPTKRQSIQSPERLPQDDDRAVDPALHPATPAIYIRNLMRPLQPTSLKNHLISLAVPGNNEPEAEPLVEFFLDSIKTHCFALFDSVTTASRVRSKLHGAVWPNERDRKPLWVDFIPEDKVNDWIKTEQDSASTGRGAQRWEVAYEETGDGIEAILQETRSGHPPTAPAHRRQSSTTNPTFEPRRESQPSAPPRQQSSGGEGFKALDDRFQSTKTKPKIYYLPVSRDIVDKRLAQFASLPRKDSRQGNGDTRRITFEDVDVFVDDGPEYRGGQNRGGRRGGRGAWRGRRR